MYGLDTVDPSDDYLDRFRNAVIANFDRTGCFEEPVSKIYVYDRNYTAENYLSWIKSRCYQYDELNQSKRVAFENEVRRLFENNCGIINIPQHVLLVMGEKR